MVEWKIYSFDDNKNDVPGTDNNGRCAGSALVNVDLIGTSGEVYYTYTKGPYNVELAIK